MPSCPDAGRGGGAAAADEGAAEPGSPAGLGGGAAAADEGAAEPDGPAG